VGPPQSTCIAATSSCHTSALARSCYLIKITALGKTSHMG